MRRGGTAFGLEAKRYMDAGELVPDEIVVGVVEDPRAPGGPLEDGFVLDGFPRTPAPGRGARPRPRRPPARPRDQPRRPAAIVLDRLAGRRVCENCQRVYHVEPSAHGRLDVRHVRRRGRAARRRHRRGDRPPARALRASRPCRSSSTTATGHARARSTVSATATTCSSVSRRSSTRRIWQRARRRRGPRASPRPEIALDAEGRARWSPRCTRHAPGRPSRARRPPISTQRRARCSAGAARVRTSSATTASRRSPASPPTR